VEFEGSELPESLISGFEHTAGARFRGEQSLVPPPGGVM